ncbi:MAG: porin family protein [Gammaproteobacteria bacterium]|nr:porin family protein [Gammaproteobacteria bacterium]MCP4089594.1 porin family protein [Gammaproteobacteria bacterium]MCP4278071.1 porin family protein [Gammaproteobacteria bacterium]MCP4832485.1 porin family protein [Gammaproteobacteria bacterium]MCP4930177.1 porin family protein [Gammaproteobacteria bacterium]
MRGILLVVLSLCATTSFADTPWYLGAGVGVTKLSQDQNLANVDHSYSDNSNGFQVFAGYEIDSRWGVEGGYIDFGDTESSGTRTLAGPPFSQPDKIKFKADGWYINGQYHLPISNYGSLDFLGGWILGDGKTTNWNPSAICCSVSDNNSESGLMLGLAFTIKLTNTVYVRGTGTYYGLDYDNNIDNPYRLGLDLIYDF